MTDYEKHVAKVTKVNDPEQRGRIKVTCVGLTGDEEAELPHWIEPVFDWGLFIVPNIGDVVEIETTLSTITDELFGQSSIDQLAPRWRGSRFYDVRGKPPSGIPHPDFQGVNYGKRRGFHTKFHTIVCDDTPGQEQVSITFRNAQGKTNTLLFLPGFLTYSDGGTLPTLRLSGSGTSAVATVGNGTAHVAIAEHLQALWGSLETGLDGFFGAVQTYIAALAAGAAGGPPGLVAAAVAAGTAYATYAAATISPTPSWDNNISSVKFAIQDNF